MNSRAMRRARGRAAIVVCALTVLLTAGISGLPGPDTAVGAADGERRGSATGDAPRAKAPRSAPTESAATTAAARSGKPVEVLSLRGERGQTFANPDGTFTAKEYARPVRTRKHGKWVDIDTTLVRRPGGHLAPRATATAVTVSGGGTGPFATMQRDGRTMSVSWPGKLPEPVVDGDTATYRSVLPDVDLVVRVENEGFAHLLVVRTPEAADHPRLKSVELPLRVRGVDLGAHPDGGFVARDRTSRGTVFEAPQPVMWDSRGAARPRGTAAVARAAAAPPDGARVADVGLGVGNGKLTLRPDMNLLKDRETRYPVFIDPVNRTTSRTGWTWVSSGSPDKEGWKFPDSDGPEFGRGVGRCPTNASTRCTGTNDVQRQYYALPTGGLGGKTILKAEFAITLVGTYNSEARSVQLHRVNSSGGSAINARTNWSNKPSNKEHLASDSPTNPAGTCSPVNQNVRFNVKGTMEKAAASGWDTTTFGLQAATEDSVVSWKRFCNNAALEITYNRPPYQPKMSELSMDPGGRCVYDEPDKHLTKVPPTLSAVIWDPDHGDAQGNTEKLRAQFEVFWTEKNGEKKSYTVTTGFLPSNTSPTRDSGFEEFTYKVGSDIPGDGTGAFKLPENTEIGWWVRGGDSEAWGPWSHEGDATRCQFILDTTKPDAPAVTSSEYPNDGKPHVGVGDYGTFTVHAPGTDVARYRYQFTGEAERIATPPEPGRPAVIRWMPPREGITTLYVEAEDRAGNSRRVTTSHRFRVTKGRAPKASWALADPVGSSHAVGGDGTAPAQAGRGVAFGADGPHGSLRTGARLDGTAEAYLNAGRHIVDTDKTFTVAAWVRLPELPDTSMSVLSQDGSAQSGFSLGYDASSRRWSFLAPDTEVDSRISWEVRGPSRSPANGRT
ncbi:LamG-like jellyroll fold domain-containing protein [Streptomyces sp. G45]|uniref:LamG-like jellyroll fold domain-containing protein n=1 Tax=Streptomyces sp. G45 TaxID=3406627 RepID=UPI003C2107D4